MTRAYNTATTQQNSGGAVAGVTAGKNAVINGGFDIWQRGTSVAFGGAGVVTSADRWATYSNGNATLSRQVTGDSTNLPFIQYCARMQRNSGDTATLLSMGNNFETINSIPFAGKTVTMSFYARKGANYSPTADAFAVYLRTGTGTDQNVIASGYTGSSGLSTTVTLTTTWQRFTLTGNIGSNVTEIAPEFRCNTTGTAGANDYAEITGVQVEVGSVATPFSRAGGTIAGELAACQRYYYFHATGTNRYISMAAAWSSSQANGYLQFPVTMRTIPTMAMLSGTNYYLFRRSTSYQYFSVLSQDTASNTGSGLYVTGLTQTAGVGGWFEIESPGTGSIAFSAEL